MANYRLRISNIIPNSWLYKLKDMNSTNKNKMKKKEPITTSSSSSSLSSAGTLTKPHNDDQLQRKSYYFTRELNVPNKKEDLPDSPRKSSKKKRSISQKKPVHRKLSPVELNSAGKCHCRVTPESVWTESNPGSNSSDTELFLSPESPNCPCKTISSYDDVYRKLDLPPIITKPAKPEEFGSGKWVIEGGPNLSVKVKRNPGGKTKGNIYSPRIGNRVRVQAINGGRKSTGNRRRGLSDSLAVVKTSVDPQKDFKESMVEMIMENNMKSSKDLEDLLACYLSLNSDEYHELIIQVFKQIWFESTNIIL